MNQAINCIDPLTTDCVLKNLSLAIDEIKLVRSINSINEQIADGDAAQLESGRRRYLTVGTPFPEQAPADGPRKSRTLADGKIPLATDGEPSC